MVITQILVTELGDETFIIAAIMAMRHPRAVVYIGAMSALVSMTVCQSLHYNLKHADTQQCQPSTLTAQLMQRCSCLIAGHLNCPWICIAKFNFQRSYTACSHSPLYLFWPEATVDCVAV